MKAPRSVAFLVALLALLPLAAPVLAARQGPLPPDRVDRYEGLLVEFRAAWAVWRDAKQRAIAEERIHEFERPSPVLTLFPRFAALAERGDGHALLWVGLNAGDLRRTAGEVADLKRDAFRRVVEGFHDERFVLGLVHHIDDQEEWLTEGELLALLAELYERSSLPEVRAASGFRLARRLEVRGGAETRAEGWYRRVIEAFPGTREATKAGERLRGLALAPGRIAPDFELRDVNGAPLTLAEQRGRVVVLVFFGLWSEASLERIPQWRALAERHAEQPFTLLGLAAGEEPEGFARRAAELGVTWRCVWQGPRDDGLARAWNVKLFPSVFVLDRRGCVRHRDLVGEALDRAVAELLAEE